MATVQSGRRELFAVALVALISGCAPAPDKSSAADRPRETTPLHTAAAAGRLWSVGELLKGGADPNVIDESGRTPLHLAAANGHGGTAEALLGAGANAEARDDTGKLAYELAVEAGHSGTASIVRADATPEITSQREAGPESSEPRDGINPSLAYRDAESFGRAIGGPAVHLSGDHVHVFAAAVHEEAARIVLPYLERAYDELYAIVGMGPAYDLVVYHFPQGHSEAFGGTSNGTIWYDDGNLRLDEHSEWREYKVPHVSGYIEEMAHNFVSTAHVQFGWEMVGWSIGIAATRKVAPNPIFEESLSSTQERQAETFRRYVAGGYVFPADIASNQVDRIHAYLLWRAEQQYGASFWKDFFSEIRKSQPELLEASAMGDANANRNARYQISWKCIDRLPGLNFREMLQENQISLTTDIKALDPESANWNRKLK